MLKQRANTHDPYSTSGPGTNHGAGLYHDYMARWENPKSRQLLHVTVGAVLIFVFVWPMRGFRRALDHARGS